MRQIPLELGFTPRFGADDFLTAASNAVAHTTLMLWPDWPDRVMVLVGPEGSGKSHLAQIWAETTKAATFAGDTLSSADLEKSGKANCLIEAADQVGLGEATLFHILNLSRESGHFALLTAQSAPNMWGVRTPDLLSRLRLAPVLRIGAPDDALVRAVLVKLFADRQLVVDGTVVDYLALRMERSIGAARKLVAALDLTSLAKGGRITRATAAEVLTSLEQDETPRHGDVTGLGQNRPGS